MSIEQVRLPSNRTFGVFFSLVFFTLSTYLTWSGDAPLSITFGALSITFFSAAQFHPALLLPLNKLWMRFGLFLGSIVSPIVLGVLFFVIFTPIALLMRRFGRDELRLKRTRLPTYWKPRDPQFHSGDSFKSQF